LSHVATETTNQCRNELAEKGITPTKNKKKEGGRKKREKIVEGRGTRAKPKNCRLKLVNKSKKK